MKWHRRSFLASLALCCAAAPGSTRAAETPSLPVVRLKLGWIANVQYAGEWIALDRGFFRDQGLDVTWTAGGPNAPDPAVMLAAGRADLSYMSWLPFLDAVARGNDLVILGTEMPRNPLGVISLPAHPVRVPRDLLGLRILAQGINETTSINAVLAIAGLPRQWTFVPAGFAPDPLLDGQGDAFVGFDTNQKLTLEMMGLKQDRDFIFTNFADLGFVTPAALLVTTRAYLTQNRPRVVAFLRALIQGWTFNETDPAVAARLVVEKYGEDYGFDLDQQILQNRSQIPFTHYRGMPSRPLLSLDRDMMAGPMYAAARAAGRTALPDIDRIADFTVVPEAFKGI